MTQLPSQAQMDAWWMPFTANRAFKANPRFYVGAEGMYMTMADGKKILDTNAGLWCCNAGHGRKEIAEAVHAQLLDMDYGNPFSYGHPKGFELANRLVEDIAPKGLNRIFFTNSGSESVDTALKIARQYWRLKGQASKTAFVARVKAYHGVNWGGVSLAGLTGNRKSFGQGLEADFMRHTLLPENAFSKGLPANGADIANELNDIIAMRDASNIAAVIVEPVAGAGGVVVPPQGYLEKLRAICDQHNILLIFDEVIAAYGRTGAATMAEKVGVTPDMITTAKGLTNGAVPMGAVFCKQEIYDTFVNTGDASAVPEFLHGYTYSAHPVACAAALATLDIYKSEKLFQHCDSIAGYWGDAVHSLKGLPGVKDIRNYGLLAGIDLTPGAAAKVAAKTLPLGVTVRPAGDTVVMSPPLIIQKEHIDTIINVLSEAIPSVS
ncbi:aminotransferase class III-fold pyridoxal phosphate-dependent enzyme [Simiduia curdlanivorans]|uniref:Aminotransferase class III-fold pyridoxal phosphate-dependent enzyme n=1 Tax=Simiduia curdlanivorans TaxID=1492769 RepID=A0ABV8V7M8_9GAMM|nr:aminotransferase class III-fold pyridoxal phosphate-dependent enzyme [Simiduia curdlanivorans]MDN3639753.1 aminotransferase class III-fold pyridoxal phosphate-dependent enzyme [Simiduia curdlanivorans]